MLNDIINEIENLEKDYNIEILDLLAQVTKTMSEVVFYAKKDGVVYHSNDLFEEDYITDNKIFDLYSKIAEIVRSSSEFDNTKTNIVTYNSTTKKINIDHNDSNKSNFTIQKEWKQGLDYLDNK